MPRENPGPSPGDRRGGGYDHPPPSPQPSPGPVRTSSDVPRVPRGPERPLPIIAKTSVYWIERTWAAMLFAQDLRHPSTKCGRHKGKSSKRTAFGESRVRTCLEVSQERREMGNPRRVRKHDSTTDPSRREPPGRRVNTISSLVGFGGLTSAKPPQGFGPYVIDAFSCDGGVRPLTGATARLKGVRRRVKPDLPPVALAAEDRASLYRVRAARSESVDGWPLAITIQKTQSGARHSR